MRDSHAHSPRGQETFPYFPYLYSYSNSMKVPPWFRILLSNSPSNFLQSGFCLEFLEEAIFKKYSRFTWPRLAPSGVKQPSHNAPLLQLQSLFLYFMSYRWTLPWLFSYQKTYHIRGKLLTIMFLPGSLPETLLLWRQLEMIPLSSYPWAGQL